ncbi:phage tail protein [Janthinobacterium sp. PC23-8]|uniref:phage tail protein n=1 Tax=Janthinobacterium sp. PC23-8 TaxID=2012679 RepID=UPI000B978FC4|nr:tail fiber protein [Janthinobacterium sp. PC23-8]OYO29003.1 hypothetical protein CD932_17905 [Janthinobacterium sp. PC23-8]
MDPLLGSIIAVGFNFVPRGWMSCAGQLLSINGYSALYALLGTQYGGDGQNTFALPDLRGRVPVGTALGIGGRINAAMGTTGGVAGASITSTGTGSAAVTLAVANLPSHNHAATFSATGGSASTVEFKVSNDAATSEMPLAGGYLATGASGGNSQPMLYASTVDQGTTTLNAATATLSGGGGSGSVSVANTGTGATLNAPVTVTSTASVPTVPPFQGVQYIICVEGVFPSRN